MENKKIYGNATVTPINIKKLVGDVDLSNYLSKDNTEAYTPSADYNPATKKYVDDAIENIDIPDVDLSDYYTKDEVYSKDEIDEIAKDIVFTGALNDYYTAAQTDGLIAAKANAADVYTKTQTDNLLNAKANKTNTLSGYGINDAYTKKHIDNELSALTAGLMLKADNSALMSYYPIEAIDEMLAEKADKSYIDTAIQNAIGNVLGGAS